MDLFLEKIKTKKMNKSKNRRKMGVKLDLGLQVLEVEQVVVGINVKYVYRLVRHVTT